MSYKEHSDMELQLQLENLQKARASLIDETDKARDILEVGLEKLQTSLLHIVAIEAEIRIRQRVMFPNMSLADLKYKLEKLQDQQSILVSRMDEHGYMGTDWRETMSEIRALVKELNMTRDAIRSRSTKLK